MRILFVHTAFPAQFGRLGLELKRRFHWDCAFLIGHLSLCPTPSPEMLESLRIVAYRQDQPPAESFHWTQSFIRTLHSASAAYEASAGLVDFKPDLIVGHLGLGPTLFLRQRFRCPRVSLCEFYFAREHRDLTYRIDLPTGEMPLFFPHAINAAQLSELVEMSAGYAPTHFQRDSFPERFRSKIAVHFDGVETEIYHPGPVSSERLRAILGRDVSPETRIVTFASRGLESMRGFDIFVQVAERIAAVRSDVLFVVAGAAETYYGWDKLTTGGESFRDWVVRQVSVPSERMLFLGQIEPTALADVLRRSDLHFYLTVPFVPGWSLFDALASGCVVLASDVGPVREVIRPGENGLVEPFFDVDAFTRTALRVLADPAQFTPLRKAAIATIAERYALEITLPGLVQFLADAANTPA